MTFGESRVSKPWKLTIAAGGTGGHISPALAIADQLARVAGECRIEFVCGTRPVELELYRKAGVAPQVIEVQPLLPGWLAALRNVGNFRRSLALARAYVAEARPQVVLGMGGYVCVPVVAEAAAAKIPTMIHEQNSVAGRANRWLRRSVTAIACAYPEAAAAFPASKTRVTGNPVRPEFVGCDRAAALARWDFSANGPTLLISGGSQGAQRLNQAVLDALPELDRAVETPGGLQLLWSCGENNFGPLQERLDRAAPRRLSVRLVPFIREMGLAYAAADVALTRAGAMTLAELTANALPALLVPLPEAIGDHQRLNALPLVRAGAAVLLEERELTGRRLAEAVSALLSDRAALDRMRQAGRRFGRPHAVEEIVSMILSLRGELS